MRRIIAGVFVYIFFVFSVMAQQNWYVSVDGDDNNPGTVGQPLRTVNAALSKAAAGDIIILRGGVYREKVELKKNDLTLKNYPGETPVMKGSVVMTGWVVRGSFWKKYVDIQPQQVFVDGDHPLQQIGYPNDWFKNQTSYSVYNNPVGSGIGDMAPGRFWWERDTLYIWLEDSSDPNSHQIEVSQNDLILTAYGVQRAYIKGITFEHSNGNTFRNQAAAVNLGSYCTLDSCTVQLCDFGGVATGYYKTGAKILHCQILHNGAVGISSSESYDFLIRDTRMAYNNYRNFYSQWHTGGYKGATYSYGTIENCEVDHNNGPGVWFDYCMHSGKYDATDGENFYPIIVRNNYFHGNGTGNYDPNSINNNASILIEVSEQALVYNNIIDTFEYRGIWISGSYFTTVTNNLLAHGSGYYSLDAGAIYVNSPPGYLKHNRIVNNIIYENATSYDLRMLPEDGTVAFDNICRNNIFFRSGEKVKMKYGSTTINSLETWQNDTPYGEESRETDPVFEDTLFHLSDQSPCINMGSNLLQDTIITDYEGNARFAGTIIDIGPYEASVGGNDAYNALLQDLSVDNGTLEPSFVTDRFVYYDTLPDNTTVTPDITATPAYAGAVVNVQNAVDVMSQEEKDRTTTVKVTSGNSLVYHQYKIIFYSKNTTGTKDLREPVWNVYPNPARDMLFVKGDPGTGHVTLTLTDMTGKTLMEQRWEDLLTKEVDLSHIPQGIYILRLEGANTVKQFRIRVVK